MIQPRVQSVCRLVVSWRLLLESGYIHLLFRYYCSKGSKISQSSGGNQNLFVKCDTDFNLQSVVECKVVPNFILLISEWSMVVRTAAAGQRANINWVNAVQFHLADRI